MLKSSQGSDQNNKKCDTATNFPEEVLCLGRVDDAGKVHAVIGGKKREGKKYDGYDCKDEDSFVLAVGDYR